MRTSQLLLADEKSGNKMATTSARHRKRLGAVTATLGIAACGLLGAGAGTATAGTNGQQIIYYNHNSYGQCTTGTNQNGKIIRNCSTFAVQGSNKDEGYYWVGRVNITWYKNGGHGTAQMLAMCPRIRMETSSIATSRPNVRMGHW